MLEKVAPDEKPETFDENMNRHMLKSSCGHFTTGIGCWPNPNPDSGG